MKQLLKYNPQIHHRRSIRLKGHDYAQPGAYFVTVCTVNRECLFGDVVDGEMVLNEFGIIVEHQWKQITRFFPNTTADEFAVMPTHFHGIVMIQDIVAGAKHPGHHVGSASIPVAEDASPLQPLQARQPLQPLRMQPIQPLPHGTVTGSFSAMMQNFISVTARKINRIRKTPGERLWQRNYFEHIIRNEKELNRIREYIRYNPAKWAEDRNNPFRSGEKAGGFK